MHSIVTRCCRDGSNPLLAYFVLIEVYKCGKLVYRDDVIRRAFTPYPKLQTIWFVYRIV